MVHDGVGGRVVPRRNGMRLAEALRQLVLDPASRERMSRHGRKHVSENFDQRHVADRYIELYRHLNAERKIENG